MMLDRDGFRPSVAIVIANAKNHVFWAKRIHEHSWQFPQGGIDPNESPEQAMYRELWEEVGLRPEHVRILGRTREWLRYYVPRQWIRREWRGSYRGQKQIWYLLRFLGRDSDFNLRATEKPEFDAWRWHDYHVPLDAVIEFKRDVYKSALRELNHFLYRTPKSAPKPGDDDTLPLPAEEMVDSDSDDTQIYEHDFSSVAMSGDGRQETGDG